MKEKEGESHMHEEDRPHFGERTSSFSESEVARGPPDTLADLGFTTDGELNRHSSERKRSTMVDRRAMEKKHYDMINDRIVEDITMDVFYKPYSISVLILFAAVLAYFAFYGTTSNSTETNYFDGFIAAAVLFLVISGMAFPNGPFIRPHPILWRVIFGMSVIYVLILQFALFQNFEDIKSILSWLDPVGLGRKKLSEKEYATDCWDLSFEKFYSHVDYFAFAHLTGWVMKTMLLRHWVLSWYISIIWELTELMFMNILPNFAECWWDALVLDVLLCNGVGIYIGMKLCKFLQMREFHWESIRNIKTRRGKMKRLVMQFTPASWNQFDWFYSKSFSSSIRRTLALTFLVVFWLIAELNTFFIKHIFAIDTQHPVVFWRIILIALMAAPTLRQYYVFSTDPLTKRVGMQCWVFVVICILEMALCVKCGKTVFSNLDFANICIWFAAIIFGTVICILTSIWYAEKFEKTTQVLVKGRRRVCYLESSHENLGMLEDDVMKRRSEYLGHPVSKKS